MFSTRKSWFSKQHSKRGQSFALKNSHVIKKISKFLTKTISIIMDASSSFTSIFKNIHKGFQTLTKYTDEKTSKSVKVRIAIFFACQLITSYISYLLVNNIGQIWRFIEAKNKIKIIQSVKNLATLGIVKALAVQILGWLRNFIHADWMMGIRKKMINETLDPKKLNYIQKQEIKSQKSNKKSQSTHIEDKSKKHFNYAQVLMSDIGNQVSLTLIATSQMVVTFIDMTWNLVMLYNINPFLITWGFSLGAMTLIAFLFSKSMSDCFNECKVLKNKIQNEVNNLLGCWRTFLYNPSLMKSTTKKLDRLFHDMNITWKKKIKIDRVGQFINRALSAVVLPLTVIVLLPELISNALSPAQFQQALFCLNNLVSLLGSFASDVIEYSAWNKTTERCNVIYQQAPANNGYIPHKKPKNDVAALIPPMELKKPDDQILFQITETIQIDKGQRYIITGETGHGKSSLINLLSACIPREKIRHSLYYKMTHTDHSIKVTPKTLVLRQQKENEPTYKPVENPTLSEYLNALYGVKVNDINRKQLQKIAITLKLVENEEGFSNKTFGEASGGEISRINLFCVLAHLNHFKGQEKANLLIFDEVFKSLNKEIRIKAYDLLNETLNKLGDNQPAIVAITHSNKDNELLKNAVELNINNNILKLIPSH